MILLCRVCAEFRAPDGSLIHKVDSKLRLVPHEAPDSIQLDPLFDMLLVDGTLSYVSSKEDQKKLEQMDPTTGIDASGKRIQPETAETDATAEENENPDADGNNGAIGNAGTAEAAGPNEAGIATETSASGKKETKSTGRARKTGGE